MNTKTTTTMLDTVRREISILHDLEHPHIVQLVEVFEDTKYIHVVQELCRGGELYQRVGTCTWRVYYYRLASNNDVVCVCVGDKVMTNL